MTASGKAPAGVPVRPLAALVAGPLLFLALQTLAPPAGMSASAWTLLALMAWMVAWWVSEALPLAATALLPVIVMPLGGILPLAKVTESYGHPLIFLFLGGFMLAIAIEEAGLHRRIAIAIVSAIGTGPRTLTLGFMLATAFLSMWITNTAATIMMVTVALSVTDFLAARAAPADAAQVRRFTVGLLLAVAYSASVGGMATLIGSPVNALLASTLAGEYGIRLEFVDWMLIGLPATLVMLAAIWLVLTRILYRDAPPADADLAGLIRTERAGLGPMRPAEWIVGAVFVLAATGWILGDPIADATGLPINDTTVAIAAAVLLFALPTNRTMRAFALDWEHARRLPWNVLLLIGGGLAVAGAFRQTGLAGWIGGNVAGLDVPLVVMILLVTVLMIFLTEIMSNPASAATILPVAAATAVGLGHAPLVLAAPAALAANMSFMLPVATAPNAIVFAHPDVRIADMVRAGLIFNLVGIAVATLLVYAVLRPLHGW
ncbi:MAG: DASS family sodium-coupled anion symporter [Acuticoccus sp.]